MVQSKKELIKTLRKRHWNIRLICLSSETLNYLTFEERCAFTQLTLDMDRQIDAFENILNTNKKTEQSEVNNP